MQGDNKDQDQNTNHNTTEETRGSEPMNEDQGVKQEQTPQAAGAVGQGGAQAQEGGKKKNHVLAIVAVIIILALVAAFFMWRSGGDVSNALNLGGDQQASTGAAGDYPDVVARVNGEEVTGEDLQGSVEQTSRVATQQGLDPNDPNVSEQIESQALEVAINSTLLIQAANKSGITVSQEDVAAEIASLEAQFGGAEQFQAQVDDLGLSQEDLQADIREQLVVDQFIEASDEVGDINVSQEEVRQAYDQIAGQQEGLPPFEEIAPQVEQQLIAQKRQQATNALIERLRAEADIEVLI